MMLSCFVCCSETGPSKGNSKERFDTLEMISEEYCAGERNNASLQALRSLSDMFLLEIQPEAFIGPAIENVGFCTDCKESVMQWKLLLKEILDLQRLMEEHFNQMAKLKQGVEEVFGEFNSCKIKDKFRIQNLIIPNQLDKTEKVTRSSKRLADSQRKYVKDDQEPLIPECIFLDSSSSEERHERKYKARKLPAVEYKEESLSCPNFSAGSENDSNDNADFEQEAVIEVTSCDSNGKGETSSRKRTSKKWTNSRVRPYECSKCVKRFKRKGDFLKHLEAHTVQQVFKCRRGCESEFNSRSTRLDHERESHPEVKPYQCSFCDLSFSQSSNLKYHEFSHTGETPFPCTLCEKKFKTRQHLKRHLQTHTGEKSATQVCNICNKEISVNTIKIHMRIHSGEKPYECDACDKKFVDSRPLKRHQRTHTGFKPFKCRHCDLTFSVWEGRKSHERIHTKEKPYKCSVCDTKFAHSCILTYHMRTHTGETPYPCTVCEKKFKCSTHLKRHMRIHTNEKVPRELCTICGQQISINTIRLHMRIHAGIKTHKCDTCNKTFVDTRSLKKHQRVHTGVKPYKCRYCDMTFALGEARISHERTHTGEKPYECSVCGKKHTTSSALTMHMRTHTGETPYPCTVCGKRFKQGTHLKRHMIIHTNIKPYLCTECGSQFSDPSALKSHMRRHTGERPFKCDVCQKTFAHGSAFRKHKHTHLKTNKSSNLATKKSVDNDATQAQLNIATGSNVEHLD